MEDNIESFKTKLVVAELILSVLTEKKECLVELDTLYIDARELMDKVSLIKSGPAPDDLKDDFNSFVNSEISTISRIDTIEDILEELSLLLYDYDVPIEGDDTDEDFEDFEDFADDLKSRANLQYGSLILGALLMLIGGDMNLIVPAAE